MIVTSGPFSRADYSERALVAKVLAAHVFNRAARCNVPDGRAFRRFLGLACGCDVEPDDAASCWATVEFCVRRAVPFPDNTELDAMAGCGHEVMSVIECKYCDCFKTGTRQLKRVRDAAARLGAAGGFSGTAMTLIAPEQEFASIAVHPHRQDIRDKIRELYAGASSVALRLVSWEMVFDIIAGASEMDADLLSRFLAERNADDTYPIELSLHPEVVHPDDWRSIVMGKADLPADLVVPENWGAPSRNPVETISSERLFAEFDPSQLDAFREAVAALEALCPEDVKTLGRQLGRYVNVQPIKRGSNYFLACPTDEGLALIYDHQVVDWEDGIAFVEWPESFRLQRVHHWFRNEAPNLGVWVISRDLLLSSRGRRLIEDFAKAIVSGR